MDKTLRKFTSHEEMRAESYRYWRTRPVSEIFQVTAKMSKEMWNGWYKMQGKKPDVERSDRTLTRIQHGPR